MQICKVNDRIANIDDVYVLKGTVYPKMKIQNFQNYVLKGTVRPEMKIVSSFTHP